MEEFISTWALYGALVLDAIAVLVVVAASLRAAFMLLLASVHPNAQASLMPARRRLGEWLGFALELLIGSDVIRTAVAPSWIEFGQLAAIIVLRFAITYALARDLKD